MWRKPALWCGSEILVTAPGNEPKTGQVCSPGQFRRNLSGMRRSVVDYGLARRATLASVLSGRTTVTDVCDAHPYLLRAAKFHGEPTDLTCPYLQERQAHARDLRVRGRTRPVRGPGEARSRTGRNGRGICRVPGLRRRGLPELCVEPPGVLVRARHRRADFAAQSPGQSGRVAAGVNSGSRAAEQSGLRCRRLSAVADKASINAGMVGERQVTCDAGRPDRRDSCSPPDQRGLVSNPDWHGPYWQDDASAGRRGGQMICRSSHHGKTRASGATDERRTGRADDWQPRDGSDRGSRRAVAPALAPGSDGRRRERQRPRRTAVAPRQPRPGRGRRRRQRWRAVRPDGDDLKNRLGLRGSLLEPGPRPGSGIRRPTLTSGANPGARAAGRRAGGRTGRAVQQTAGPQRPRRHGGRGNGNGANGNGANGHRNGSGGYRGTRRANGASAAYGEDGAGQEWSGRTALRDRIQDGVRSRTATLQRGGTGWARWPAAVAAAGTTTDRRRRTAELVAAVQALHPQRELVAALDLEEVPRPRSAAASRPSCCSRRWPSSSSTSRRRSRPRPS